MDITTAYLYDTFADGGFAIEYETCGYCHSPLTAPGHIAEGVGYCDHRCHEDHGLYLRNATDPTLPPACDQGQGSRFG